MRWMATILFGITLFVASNIDDIFILLAFFSDPRLHKGQIILGQYLGIGLLIGVSLAAAAVSLVLPPAYVGLLGLAPIAIGIKKLFDREDEDDDAAGARAAGKSGIGNIAAVAAVTIANGGDNIGVYVPVFATRPDTDTAIIVAVFGIMTGLLCLLAVWLVNHRTIGGPIRRYGRGFLPLVLIGLGCLILYEAGTLDLLAG